MSTTKSEAKSEALKDLVNNPVSRRDFAKRTIAGSFAAAGLFATGGAAQVFAQTMTDVAILNFALNLEYLEAEFYQVATTGQRISDVGIGITGTGRPGPTTGGSRVSLDAVNQYVADQITIDETMHVRFLRTALGSAAIAKPAINLAALGIGFATQNEFLILSRAFEDLGVSAYAGAARLIDSRNVLEAAARIALTEGQHVGLLRYLAGIQFRIAPIPQVDNKDVPVVGSPNGRLFQVDGNGLTTIRTAGEVLKVAYGGGTTSGGFFPAGVNGDITRAS